MSHGGMDHGGGHHGHNITENGGHLGNGYEGHSGHTAVSQFLHITAHPHGSLAVGFEPGLGYAAGHHAAHMGNAHIGLADTLAVAIAISVASQHGGGHSLQGFHHGGLHAVPAFHRCGLPQRGGRELNLPGIGRDKTSVEVLVWPHSRCAPQQKIRELAAKCRLKRINVLPADPAEKPPVSTTQMNGLPDVDNRVDKIGTWVPFDQSDPVTNLPDGWYPGATGWTHTWREYYQVPHCTLPFFSDPDWVPWRTFLVVTGVTWYFAEMDDYETRIAFTVYSIPFVPTKRQAPPKELRGLVGNSEGGQWTYDWADMKEHRDRAERLARGIFNYLNEHPACQQCIDKRQALHLQQLAAAEAEAAQAAAQPVKRRRRKPKAAPVQPAIPPATFDTNQHDDDEAVPK